MYSACSSMFSAQLSTPPAWGLRFLDAEKVFDYLKWVYLWRVLKSFKFVEKLINMIAVVYANPSARTSIARGFSEIFQMKRRTRQGNPLSPLIFNFSIEPLAQLIRLCPQYSLSRLVHWYTLSLYFHDTLIYMADIQHSLPRKNLNILVTSLDIKSNIQNWL